MAHRLHVSLRERRARWLLVETFRGNVTVRAEPFGAFELALGTLWDSAGKPAVTAAMW